MPTAKNTALKAVTLDHPVNDKVRHEMQAIHPALAAEWLGSNHGNRNQRLAHIDNLARDMADGKWRTTNASIAFDWNGNLIDGQHRLSAVIASGVTISCLVVRGLQPEAREVIDTNAKRSASDALRFAGYSHDPMQLAAVARIAMARSVGYLQYALDSSIPAITNSESVEWAENNPGFDHALSLSRQTARAIGIQPSAWAYCLMEMIKVDAAAAVEFATSTADFRTNGKGDPRYALLDVYRRAQAGTRRKPNTAEAIYTVFKTWNAWRTGQRLAQVIPTRGDGTGSEIPQKLK